MSNWYILSVFIHVIAGAFWIGGMLFLPLVVLPGIKQHPDRISILYKTGITFRFYGWIAILTLALTGILNMYFKGLPLSWDFLIRSGYGHLVFCKIILFVTMLTISGIHDFFIGGKAIAEMQKSGNERFKLIARWSGRINLVLALTMAFIGILLSRGVF